MISSGTIWPQSIYNIIWLWYDMWMTDNISCGMIWKFFNLSWYEKCDKLTCLWYDILWCDMLWYDENCYV